MKAQRTALIAYKVPPNINVSCLTHTNSYVKLAIPEMNRQKYGINLESVLEGKGMWDKLLSSMILPHSIRVVNGMRNQSG
jgi:hypothetical protein